MSDFTRIQEFILLAYNISVENATRNQIIEAVNHLDNEDNYVQECNSSLNEYQLDWANCDS